MVRICDLNTNGEELKNVILVITKVKLSGVRTYKPDAKTYKKSDEALDSLLKQLEDGHYLVPRRSEKGKVIVYSAYSKS